MLNRTVPRTSVILATGFLMVSCTEAPPAPQASPAPTESAGVRVETVADGVAVPFGMTFLSARRALVTDRADGRLLDLDVETGAIAVVDNVPEVYTRLDGGMLDVVTHPDYANNGWIYLSYSRGDDEASQTVVERARLADGRLVERTELFAALPLAGGANHYGSRLALRDGYLFIAQGDRTERDQAQDLSSHNGKILRVHDDGRVPDDNPFVDTPGARPEIWSYGHRNPQGLAFHPQTGELWSNEHGPLGGDEINVIVRGANYGWPLVSFGREYTGEPVGQGRVHAEDTEQPLLVYVPSIAPSGMSYYDGAAFPEWRGSFLIGALALRHLNRVRFHQGVPQVEERLLLDESWRVRFAVPGPDGFVYVGADGAGIVRLRPS